MIRQNVESYALDAGMSPVGDKLSPVGDKLS